MLPYTHTYSQECTNTVCAHAVAEHQVHSKEKGAGLSYHLRCILSLGVFTTTQQSVSHMVHSVTQNCPTQE